MQMCDLRHIWATHFLVVWMLGTGCMFERGKPSGERGNTTVPAMLEIPEKVRSDVEKAVEQYSGRKVELGEEFRRAWEQRTPGDEVAIRALLECATEHALSSKEAAGDTSCLAAMMTTLPADKRERPDPAVKAIIGAIERSRPTQPAGAPTARKGSGGG